jgi:hypothetical protein
MTCFSISLRFETKFVSILCNADINQFKKSQNYIFRREYAANRKNMKTGRGDMKRSMPIGKGESRSYMKKRLNITMPLLPP